MVREHEDLIKHLNQQIDFLDTSCLLFDSGKEHEAKRIATTIRVLVHDTKISVSLLKQLDYKDLVKFLDSSLPLDPELVDPVKKIWRINALPGLVGIKVASGKAKFIAPLKLREGSGGMISFPEWWESGCIPSDDERRYSRRDLILWVSNKEGGAHIDEKVNKAYMKLNEGSLGMSFSVGGTKKGFDNSPIDASIRQIAWEVLDTLRRLPPELF